MRRARRSCSMAVPSRRRKKSNTYRLLILLRLLLDDVAPETHPAVLSERVAARDGELGGRDHGDERRGVGRRERRGQRAVDAAIRTSTSAPTSSARRGSDPEHGPVEEPLAEDEPERATAPSCVLSSPEAAVPRNRNGRVRRDRALQPPLDEPGLARDQARRGARVDPRRRVRPTQRRVVPRRVLMGRAASWPVQVPLCWTATKRRYGVCARTASAVAGPYA